MKKSRIASPVPHTESPLRHLPLVDLLVDTKTELLELALRSGLKVFTTMLEEDRTAICGPRYAHEPERPASRVGTTRSEVVLGGITGTSMRDTNSRDRRAEEQPILKVCQHLANGAKHFKLNNRKLKSGESTQRDSAWAEGAWAKGVWGKDTWKNSLVVRLDGHERERFGIQLDIRDIADLTMTAYNELGFPRR